MAETEPFVWGAGGGRLTPEQIAQNRKLAQMLLEKGIDSSPIQHPLQGVDRVAKALLGGYEFRQADAASRANIAADADWLKSVYPQPTAPVAPAATPTPAPPVPAPAANVAPPVAPTVVGMNGTPSVPDAQGVYPADATMLPPVEVTAPRRTANAGGDFGNEAVRFYVSKGLSPVAAAGLAGNFKQESAGFNPSEVHDGGIGIGLAGWNGSRRTALQRFAAERGLPVNDRMTQLEFSWHELNGPERKTLDALRTVGRPDEAARVAQGFFRPGDPQTHNRIRNAEGYFSSYGAASPNSARAAFAALPPNAQATAYAPTPAAGPLAPDPTAVPMNVAAAPPVAAPAPVPSAPVARVAQAMTGADPRIIAKIMDPYASENAKAIAKLMFQHQLQGDSVTTVDLGNAVVIMDKRGNIIRQIPKGEPNKGPQFTETGEIDPQTGQPIKGWVDPRDRSVAPYRPNPPAQASTIPPVPPGVDPKVWREAQSKRAAEEGLPADQKVVSQLRQEVQQLPSYKNIAQAAPVYKSMLDAAGRDNRAADVNLIYGMAKVMDPGSVVRESEMTVAQAIATLPQQLQSTIASQLQGTGRLSPEVRQALMQEARSRLLSYQGMFDQDAEMFKGIALRGRMNAEDVIPKFGTFDEYKPKASVPANAPVAINPKTGERLILKDGKWVPFS